MTSEDYRVNAGLSSGKFAASIVCSNIAAYPPPVRKIAVNLGRLLDERRISQPAVAKALGHSAPTSVNRWVRDQRLPTKDNLVALARFFGVAVEEIDPDHEVWLPEHPRKNVRKERTPPVQFEDHKPVAGATEPQYPSASSPRAELVPEGGIEMADSPEWLELRSCFDRLSPKARSKLLAQAHILAAEAHTAAPPNQRRGGLEAHQRKKTGRR